MIPRWRVISTRRIRQYFKLLSLGLVMGSATVATADEVEVAKAEAFLVQGHSGTLSANIMPPASTIDFWNTIIGEGGAGEGSNDVLLVVHFRRLKQSEKTDKISIRVTDEAGKLLLERKDVYLWFDEGAAAAKSVLLEDVGCTHLKISAAVGKKTSKFELPFACGE